MLDIGLWHAACSGKGSLGIAGRGDGAAHLLLVVVGRRLGDVWCRRSGVGHPRAGVWRPGVAVCSLGGNCIFQAGVALC